MVAEGHTYMYMYSNQNVQLREAELPLHPYMVAHNSPANPLPSKDMSSRIIVTSAYCTNYTSEIKSQYMSAISPASSILGHKYRVKIYTLKQVSGLQHTWC